MQRRSKRKRRSDPLNLEKERITKQQWRSDARNKAAENTFGTKTKSLKRKTQTYYDKEKRSAKQKKYGLNITDCIEIFHESISAGPIYVCSCCHQTWFKQSVSEAKSISSDQRARFLTKLQSAENKEWICTTCRVNILCNKVPKLSVLNGMKWPDKPKELELFPLEERLISLRIPFMQIRELPRGRQLSVKGNVVNVPVDIQPVVEALPRPLDENVTIPVKLKKKLSHKSCAFTENVRPLRVLVALHWLMNHSNLYKHTNVDIDEEWIKKVTESSNEILNELICSDTETFSSKETTDIPNTCDNRITDVSNDHLSHQSTTQTNKCKPDDENMFD